MIAVRESYNNVFIDVLYSVWLFVFCSSSSTAHKHKVMVHGFQPNNVELIHVRSDETCNLLAFLAIEIVRPFGLDGTQMVCLQFSMNSRDEMDVAAIRGECKGLGLLDK